MSNEAVRQLPLEQVLDLRVRVLRRGTPFTHANYPVDSYPDAVHFGIVRDGDVCHFLFNV